MSRSLNITAVPSLNLTDLSQVKLCKDFKADSSFVESRRGSYISNDETIASISNIPKDSTFSIASKVETEGYIIVENQEPIKIVTPQTQSMHQKPPQHFTQKLPQIQKIRHSVNLSKTPPTKINTRQTIQYNKRELLKNTETFEIEFKKPKINVTIEDVEIEELQESILPVVPAIAPTNSNKNKLMALFEITPDQFKILNEKLNSGKEDEAIFDFSQNEEKDPFKNYGKT